MAKKREATTCRICGEKIDENALWEWVNGEYLPRHEACRRPVMRCGDKGCPFFVYTVTSLETGIGHGFCMPNDTTENTPVVSGQKCIRE